MLTEHRNENLAEMLKNVKTDVNSVTLLKTVIRAIIELYKVTHYIITVSLTDCSDEGDSEAEKEEQKKKKRERKITVKKREKITVKKEKEITVKRKKRVMM